jgi:cytochrome P450
VYQRVLKITEVTEEEVELDLMLILGAAYETTAKALCTGLLELKRNPGEAVKLKAEIES